MIRKVMGPVANIERGKRDFFYQRSRGPSAASAPACLYPIEYTHEGYGCLAPTKPGMFVIAAPETIDEDPH